MWRFELELTIPSWTNLIIIKKVTIFILFKRPLWLASLDFCYLRFSFNFGDTTWLFFLNLRWPLSLVFLLNTGSSYPFGLLFSKRDMKAKLNLLRLVNAMNNGVWTLLTPIDCIWVKTLAVDTILLNVIIWIDIIIINKKLNEYLSIFFILIGK